MQKINYVGMILIADATPSKIIYLISILAISFKGVNDFQLLTIFAKISILVLWQSSEYASEFLTVLLKWLSINEKYFF